MRRAALRLRRSASRSDVCHTWREGGGERLRPAAMRPRTSRRMDFIRRLKSVFLVRCRHVFTKSEAREENSLVSDSSEQRSLFVLCCVTFSVTKSKNRHGDTSHGYFISFFYFLLNSTLSASLERGDALSPRCIFDNTNNKTNNN